MYFFNFCPSFIPIFLLSLFVNQQSCYEWYVYYSLINHAVIQEPSVSTNDTRMTFSLLHLVMRKQRANMLLKVRAYF